MAKKRGPGNPNWRPGVSGNPSGLPKSVRLDGFSNAYTGHGTADDARVFTRHFTRPVSETEALDLRRGNWLAKRIVELLPGECFAKGYAIKLGDKELEEQLTALVEEMCLDEKLIEAGALENTVGGAAVYPVLDGAIGDMGEPLDLDSAPRILGVRALHIFESRELQPLTWYDDITHPKYRMPSRYRVQALSSGGAVRSTNSVIHESRLAIFPGVRVSVEQQPGQPWGWGDSKLTPVVDVIQDYGLAWGSAATILRNFSERVQAVKDLMKILSTRGGGAAVRENLKELDRVRSTLRTRVVDAESNVSEQAKSVAGLSDMLVQFAQLVSAAADVPITRLFGMSPAGLNSTGEYDDQGWAKRVASEQKRKYRANLEWLIRMILLSAEGPTGGKEPDVWSIEWRPLKQHSESEIAAMRKTVAETDQIYVDMGMPAERVLEDRFGGDTYSMETTFDAAALNAQREADSASAEDAQSALAAMDDQPGGNPAIAGPGAGVAEDVQKLVLNGAQVTSMVDVVRATVSGEIPRESAMQIVQVAFGVSPDQASRLLGPEGFEPEKPAAAPPQFGQPVEPPEEPDQEARADDARNELVQKLGGKCVLCSATDGLEIDHVHGRDWDPATLSKQQRADRYRSEHDDGVYLQVLCRSCNASDGAANKQKSRGPKAKDE
jgi:uncharacterized protein